MSRTIPQFFRSIFEYYEVLEVSCHLSFLGLLMAKKKEEKDQPL